MSTDAPPVSEQTAIAAAMLYSQFVRDGKPGAAMMRELAMLAVWRASNDVALTLIAVADKSAELAANNGTTLHR